MSNNLILELKEHKVICEKFKFSMEIAPEDHLELIELLMNSHINKHLVESKKDEEEEDENYKRSNSCEEKKINSLDNQYPNNNKLLEYTESHKEEHKKIEKDIFILLKDIFDKRYKLYPNSVCSLSEYSIHIKKKVEMYCSNSHEMSIYILYILHQNFIDLFKYIDKVVDLDTIKLEDFNSLKEILYHIAKDVKKIFKNAFNTLGENTNFKLSNVLVVMLNDYLDKEKKLKEREKINAALYEDYDYFFGFVKKIKNLKYIPNFSQWVNEPSDEIFEEGKPKINKEKDIEINENNKENNEINSNINNENRIQEKEIAPVINLNNVNNINSENKKNININSNYNEKNNNKINDVQKLNIEDLVNYINEPKSKNNNKKKGKRKKKKAKKENKEESNEKNESSYIDDDLEIINFKKSIEESNGNGYFLYPKKIEPKLSQSFLKKLKNYEG